MSHRVILSDLALSRRLERTEGSACTGFAQARRHLFPECGSEWMECAGAHVVFDGVDSPITQTFGLGIFEPLTPESLDTIERFFRDRGSPVMHEVSPLAGVDALGLLCGRGYRPIEISTVLCQRLTGPPPPAPSGVRVIAPDEAEAWAEISARAWAAGHPEFEAFARDAGLIAVHRAASPCFLAELDGLPAAVGGLSLHEGVALFAGAATVPEFRRRGLQSALLAARLRYAAEHGCDLAMMVAEAGSTSQRNAQRAGFQIAYTRVKWRLE